MRYHAVSCIALSGIPGTYKMEHRTFVCIFVPLLVLRMNTWCCCFSVWLWWLQSVKLCAVTNWFCSRMLLHYMSCYWKLHLNDNFTHDRLSNCYCTIITVSSSSVVLGGQLALLILAWRKTFFSSENLLERQNLRWLKISFLQTSGARLKFWGSYVGNLQLSVEKSNFPPSSFL